MAAKRTIPVFKKAAPKIDDRAAQLKEAANKAAEQPEPAVTHQGPGTGKAGAADPAASAAILNAGKAASPVVETKGAAVQAAAEQARDRAADGALEAGAKAGDSAAGKLSDPKLPGEQAADGGTASGGGGSEAGGGLKGPTPAFSDGANLAALDAAVAAAAGKLAESRPDLRGGLDVFDSVAGGATASAGSSGGNLDVANPGRPGTGSDGSAEHAADAVGQVTSGGQSLFGDRLAGVSGEMAIAQGLINSQDTAASSPGVAAGGNVITQRAMELAEKAADGDEDAYRKLEVLADEMHKGGKATGVTSGVGYGVGTNADGEVVAPAGSKPAEEAGPFWRAVAKMFTGERDIAGNLTTKGQALKDAENSIENPGDPNNPDGGMATPEQMAFRQALRDALGVYQGGSGDIDPAETDSMPGGLGAFAGAANDNLGLIGQPAGPGGGPSGTPHAPVTGTDVDPVEGSAYSGPALGGNPEDVNFGSSTLPLDSARHSSSDDDDDDDDDDDGDDVA